MPVAPYFCPGLTVACRLFGLPREPVPSLAIELFDLGTDQARHVALDLVADQFLHVGKVAVALRQRGERLLVEAEGCCGIDRIDPVLLVDRLAADDAPLALPLLQEIVEPPGADDVAE